MKGFQLVMQLFQMSFLLRKKLKIAMKLKLKKSIFFLKLNPLILMGWKVEQLMKLMLLLMPLSMKKVYYTLRKMMS